MRANVDETTEDVAAALRLWLIGRLIQMLLVGALSTLAAWLIVVAVCARRYCWPCRVYPLLGPIIASIPAVLVAATNGLEAVLWTILAYLLIHQLEGEIFAPLIQRQMVYIPPAMMLPGIVTIGSAFGVAALIFAAPMVVVVFVAINKLYLRETLGESVSLPGEQ